MRLRRAADIAVGVLIGAAVAALGPADADHLGPARWQQATVTVETEPGIDVATIITPWNRLAGRTFLVAVAPGTPAEILWSPTAERSTATIVRDGDRMQSCRIRYGPGWASATHVLRHELGHCLGFADHFTVATRWRPEQVQCNDPTATNHSNYRGVMAYCGFHDPPYRAWRWWGPSDVDMFRRAYP